LEVPFVVDIVKQVDCKAEKKQIEIFSYDRASCGAAVLRPYTFCGCDRFPPLDFFLARLERIAQAGRRLGYLFDAFG
jgi:hypothetical protein